MLHIDHVHFAFEEQEALRDVSLRFETGKLHVLLGPNGSGKTTLVRCMAGVLHPIAGQVLLRRTPVTQLNARQRAEAMSWVSQGVAAEWAFSVLDTVLMGRYAKRGRFGSLTAEDVTMAQEALRETGMSGMAERPVTALSGGELQRVLVARALCQSSPIMLLDEPVSHLDIRHQIDILQAVKRRVQQQGCLAICVLHDLNLTARFADRVVLLHEGQVASDGNCDEVLQSQVLQPVYGLPIRRVEDAQQACFIAGDVDSLDNSFL